MMLLLGIASGLIFHFYQLFIRATKLKRILLYIVDFSLWIIMIIIIFSGVILINQGEVRVYVFIALLGGMFFYFKKMAKFVENTLKKIVNKILNIISIFITSIKNILLRLSMLFKRKNNDDPPHEPPL